MIICQEQGSVTTMATNSNQRNQQLAAAAAAVVSEDPQLKKELSSLIGDMVKHQRYVMRYGAPADKLSLTKSILPQMLAAMNTVAQSESEAEEREAYDRMRAELRGEKPDNTITMRAI